MSMNDDYEPEVALSDSVNKSCVKHHDVISGLQEIFIISARIRHS